MLRHKWGHAILFSYEAMIDMRHNRTCGKCFGFYQAAEKIRGTVRNIDIVLINISFYISIHISNLNRDLAQDYILDSSTIFSYHTVCRRFVERIPSKKTFMPTQY